MGNFKSIDDLITGYEEEESPKTPTRVINDEDLILGLSESKKDISIFIPQKSRYLNTLVIGSKGTGKTECLLPKMVEQDFKTKKAGVTIITSKKEMGYNLYTLAKYYKYRENDIIFLKPSINNLISNKLLWKTEYNYDFINEFIINYKEAIKKKKVVIIDIEPLKYKSEGIRTVAMLLLQFELDMQETDITQKTPHMLYVDDGQLYFPFLKDIANNSDNYNVGITLFLQSRNQLIYNSKDYSTMIDNDFRNILLLNNLAPTDIQYYQNKFKNYELSGRKFNSIVYEIVDNFNTRRIGQITYSPIESEFWTEIETKSRKNRTKLLNKKRKYRELELQNELDNKVKENDTYLEYADDEPIMEEYPSVEEPAIINEKDDKDDIKNIIRTEEKTVKRKLSQEIFNKLNNNVEICSNNFLFSFNDED